MSYQIPAVGPEVFDELHVRLELLESNIAALPAIIVESIISAFDGIRYNEVLLDIKMIDEHGGNLKDSNGLDAKPIVKVDGKEVIDKLATELESVLRTGVNFDELSQLRARVRELEEDLGYRRKVAERLMEPPKGNGR